MFDDSFKGNSSVGVITLYYKVRRSKSRTRDIMQKASAVFTLFSCLTQSTPSLGEDNLCVYLFAPLAHVEIRWLVPKFAQRSRVLKAAAKRYT